MKTRKVTFPGALGTPLAGRLDRPDSGERACALFAHCFTCGKDLKAAHRIGKALVERGIAVLRFDFTGLGESEGDFAGTTFQSNLDDLVAAAAFLRREVEAPQILVGHSLGGAAVIAAAERIPETVAVATIGAPSDTAHLRQGLLAGLGDEAPGGPVEVTIGGRRFPIAPQLLEDLRTDHVELRLARLRRALLVMHSPVDAVVAIDHARRIYQGARHPKSFVSLHDADHLLTREADAVYAADVLAAWVGRYLPPADDAPTYLEAMRLEPGQVLVRGGPEGYAQDVRTAEHALTADEPRDVPGGTARGPDPYELVLAGLGACTSMTLRMVADREGWPLEGVSVLLQHDRVHSDDSAGCETGSRRIGVIRRQISLSGLLDSEQRQRLLAIAERCPVHRTLTRGIHVESRLVGEEDG